MTSFLIDLFTDKIFLSVLFSMMISNTLKILTNWIMTDKVDFSVFVKTGGMPSSHSATVISLTSAIYLQTGMSPVFVASLIFSMIIISDAVGIRRSAGKQAEILNEMMEDLRFRKFKTQRLYEILGHTPRQVVAGAILGIVVSRFIFFIF